jgi:hypothetical protein
MALREISPAIWRRVLVRSDSTIADLHYTIQIAMGWSDSHLNRFLIHGKEYGVYHTGGMLFTDNPEQVRLANFEFRIRERFLYEYDFGDHWQHDIRVERKLPADSKRAYPRCIGGRRAAPPEDCGGPWAFMALEQHYSPYFIAERLGEILNDEEGGTDFYREKLEALRCWLDTERFGRRAVNHRLKQYASGDETWMWD